MAKQDARLQEMIQLSVILAPLLVVLEKKGIISKKEIMDEVSNLQKRTDVEFRNN